MNNISETQKRRAENIIWTAAARYDFSPDFKVFDEEGQADLYWNCIVGAVRRHYDYPQFEAVFRGFRQYEDYECYESLFWLGLENCVYHRELPERPVLSWLRQEYARAFIKEYGHAEDHRLYEAIATSHFRRALGENVKLNKYDEKLLDELEFSPEMSTEEIVSRTHEMFLRWFQINTEERKQRERNKWWLFGLKKRRNDGKKTRYRRFGIGYADHPSSMYGSGNDIDKQHAQLNTKLTAEQLRAFIETKYGKPIFNIRQRDEIERELCSGNHKGCHLHFTRGERIDIAQVQNGFEALTRQREAAQVEKNRQYYRDHINQNNTSIAKLSQKIQNSVLLHMQPAPVKSNSGKIRGGRVWRALHLNDDRVFVKNEQDDMGDFSVDILLDASTSQQNRQETVSSQGYMIAQSLSRCNIPCRVMSFCSMTGYTIVRVFRDYNKPQDNEKIFEYVSNGCNRDGLAIAAAHRLMNESRCEHKMLIVLSDVKPNDVVKMKHAGSDELIPYDSQPGITDTALEVRRARADGIAVICVFTGEDEDLPAAKLVYGRDFARVQSLDQMADTVGKLIQNQIKNL